MEIDEWMRAFIKWTAVGKSHLQRITLVVGGSFICGEISNQYEFFNAVSHVMEPGNPKAETSKIEGTIWSSEINEKMTKGNSVAEINLEKLEEEDMITLKNVTVYPPGRLPFKTDWMHCRIASVDAWHFGRIPPLEAELEDRDIPPDDRQKE